MTAAPTAAIHTTAVELMTALGQATGLAHDVIATPDWGNVWNLVIPRYDGTWVLTEDSDLCWYPGGTWTEDGSEPEFVAHIDCTTPRHLAAAAAAIITAPADERAYVAAIEGR